MGFISTHPPPTILDERELAFWERAYFEMASHFARKQKRRAIDDLGFSRLCAAYADRAVTNRRIRLLSVEQREKAKR